MTSGPICAVTQAQIAVRATVQLKHIKHNKNNSLMKLYPTSDTVLGLYQTLYVVACTA
jgi:hypothetical protein